MKNLLLLHTETNVYWTSELPIWLLGIGYMVIWLSDMEIDHGYWFLAMAIDSMDMDIGYMVIILGFFFSGFGVEAL